MIPSKEASLRLGKAHRTIRLYCQQGRLNCEKINNKWYVDENSLEDFISVKVVGKNEAVRQTGKEKDTAKSIALPPYHLLIYETGALKKEVEMLYKIIDDLKAKNELLNEQLDYRKLSWIRKLFKR